MDDINGGITLVSQILGTPLTESVTGHPFAVTVGGKDGLSDTGAGEIVGENSVHKVINIFVDVSSVHPFLVVGGGRGDGEIVPLSPVPLGVDPVEGKGHDGQKIGVNGVLRPGGVNLAGGHIFDVILVADPVVCGGSVLRDAVVDDHVLWNDYSAQYNLAGLRHGLDLSFGYLGREIAKECMGGNDHQFFLLFGNIQRIHADGLQGELICKDLGAGYINGLIIVGSYLDIVL